MEVPRLTNGKMDKERDNKESIGMTRKHELERRKGSLVDADW